MKIALIGNMNNMFFSILRYLDDLNMDAHLFLYQNEYEHFKPDNDTFNLDNYKSRIHNLSVSNSGKGLILFNKQKVKKELNGYDIFIGCGIAPALFYKLNYTLDIFIPYGDVFEFTVLGKFKFKNLLRYISKYNIVRHQTLGIRYNTKKIICSTVQEVTKDTISKLDLSSKVIKNYVPMVYKEKNYSNSELKNIMDEKDLVIFSHTRHHWKDLIEDYQKKDGGKGLDKLILGYGNFVKNNPNVNSILIFFEYGQDVNASKELIIDLKIEKHVKWLKLMPRKEIMQLIDSADIVVDALSSGMWGGVGWEGLSCGKLIMQNIVQSDKEYYDEMGHELPFILKANRPEQIEIHLNDFLEHRNEFLEKSKKNKIWFDTYAGIGLVKEYKKIIEQLYKDKNEFS